MDIPYSGIPGYFIGLESCCGSFLCSKYKFNNQRSRKNNIQKWMLSPSCELSKERRDVTFRWKKKKKLYIFTRKSRRCRMEICSVYVCVYVCAAVCVAVKMSAVQIQVCVHFEGPINTVGLIWFKLKWKTCFDPSMKNSCVLDVVARLRRHLFSVCVCVWMCLSECARVCVC